MKVDPNILTVNDIIQMDKEQVLRVDPEYQRGAEWSTKQEKLLIDSMLRNYPIPLFFFHVKHSQGKWAQNTFFFIVDGQQRVNAICNFVGNHFQLFDPTKDKKTGLPRFLLNQECPWAGKSFDSMPSSFQEKFLATPLHVMMVETEDENEVRDLFVRLQAGLPLSAQEKRDAWPGDFTKFIIEIAGKVSRDKKWIGHDFYNKLLRGTVGRGNMRKTCAQMFMLLYSRKMNQYKPDSFSSLNGQDIDNFYRYHVDFNSQSEDSFAPRFREILDEACRILDHRKRPKLEVHMAFNIVLFFDMLLGNFTSDWKEYFSQALDKFLEYLTVARRNKKDEYWLGYGQYTGVSASSKGAIEQRYRFFESEMLDLMPPLCPIDSKRGFSYAEKEFIYFSQKKNCFICNEFVEWSDAEIHHEIPHAAGGPTTLENAKLVHAKCNPRGPYSGNPPDIVDESLESNKPWENGDDKEGFTKKVIPGGKRIRFSHLYAAGLLENGCKILYSRNNDIITSEFEAPKTIIYHENGHAKKYSSLNSMLTDLLGTSQNIWLKTIVEFPDGSKQHLNDLREVLIQRMSEGNIDLSSISSKDMSPEDEEDDED